ncbi:MAG: heparan-alpha-glucosaminide N-acetyltransferase domain-containing protein [Flavobacteriaceae bacterium]
MCSHFCFSCRYFGFFIRRKRESKKQRSKFLFTRGLWLIFIELTVVNFAWMFDIGLEVLNFQVIWAIGISMVFLSFLVYLQKGLILILGIVLVAGHNLLDNITAQGSDPLSVLWYFLHQSNFTQINDGRGMLIILYPFVPWLGLMLLGYCFGTFYDKNFDAQSRKKYLLILGLGAIALFVVLRTFNIYGDIAPWSPQENETYSFLSFLNTTKYPPSLLFVVMTLGPSLLFLYVTEKIQNKLSTALVVKAGCPSFFTF